MIEQVVTRQEAWEIQICDNDLNAYQTFLVFNDLEKAKIGYNSLMEELSYKYLKEELRLGKWVSKFRLIQRAVIDIGDDV
tara:strand:- start:19363 stop:19602 length:240 start_codon:yes stop_codon:yes gene_type:complete